MAGKHKMLPGVRVEFGWIKLCGSQKWASEIQSLKKIIKCVVGFYSFSNFGGWICLSWEWLN